LPRQIKAYLQLTKPVITLSVAFSALMGFIMAEGSFSGNWYWLYLGVLLTAAGSSAINHLQESGPDSQMKRTSNRPLPSGIIKPAQAAVWAAFLVISGTALLWIYTYPLAAALALINLAWYNLIYTPLKRYTSLAVIPGAMVGAIPPAIGWVAAAQSILHPHIILVALFFFIGQIPHFWLILMKHSNDYQKAGFPSVTSYFSIGQITRLTMMWVTAMALTAVSLPLFGVIKSAALTFFVGIISLAVIISFRNWIVDPGRINIKHAFIILNIYYLLMMLVIITDAILR
jgi:heme o synthase